MGDDIQKIKQRNGGTIDNTYAVIKMKDCVTYLEFLNSCIPYGEAREKTIEQNEYLDYEYLCILGALWYINFIPENITDIEDRGKGKSYGRGKGQQIKVEYNDYAIEILKYAIDNRGRTSTVKGKATPPVPILTRQAIHAVIYNTLMGIHSESNKSNSSDKRYNVVKNNRRKFIYANYENSILDRIGIKDHTLNKWGMYPVKDYKHEMTEPVLLDVYRNGKKRDDLLFTLSRLISYTYPTRFVDVFGGTGVVTAALPKKKVEVLNEFDPFTFNFLECVQKDAKRVLNICRGMHKELVDFDKSENSDWIKWGKGRKDDVLEDLEIKHNFDKSDYENIKTYPDFYVSYQAFAHMLLEDLKNYSKNIIGCKAIQNEDLLFRYAAIWYFLHSFESANPSNNPDINNFMMKNYPDYLEKLGFINLQTGVYDYKFAIMKPDPNHPTSPDPIKRSIMDNPTLFTQPIAGAAKGDYIITDDVELVQYGKRLKHVSLRNESFEMMLDEADMYAVTGMNTIKDKTEVEMKQSILATPEQTVVYLDPPYFLTAQYNNPFPDSYHMIMLGWMRNTECRWVMSCKDSITNTSSDQDYRYGNHSDAPLIKSFKAYFEILGYGYEKEIDASTGKEYYVKDSKNNRLMENLYVYKNVDERHNEIMIANFYVAPIGRSTFDLYWKKIPSNNAKNREKKVNNKKYIDTPFFICEDYKDFLARL